MDEEKEKEKEKDKDKGKDKDKTKWVNWQKILPERKKILQACCLQIIFFSKHVICQYRDNIEVNG